MSESPGARVLPVLLAGGASRRFGSPKALAALDGRPLFEHGCAALQRAAGPVVVVANEPEPFEARGLPVRADLRPGSGVLGGILTAVRWAEECGCEAALVLACDMPFVRAGLLKALAAAAGRNVVAAPESGGPRGCEPLCAAYGTGAGGPIEAALDRGDRSVISFFPEMEVRLLPLADVRSFGDPDRQFFNINRSDDYERAVRMGGSDGESSHREQRTST